MTTRITYGNQQIASFTNDRRVLDTDHTYVDDFFVVTDETPNITLQAKSASPTESQQVVEPDSGYDGISSVTVGAISSSYVGSGITQRSSSDLTASGATVSVPSGYYASNASKAVSSGSEGTPTATKGTVSNHSVSVTPSVTNTTGYITGGTKTGTAVTVSASELVDGTYAVNSSGTKDVTNYASASVPAGSVSASASKGTVSNHAISVTPTATVGTAGYLAAGSTNGTAISVSASELVSGNLAITQNGTGIDVTNYATVSVSVEGGGGSGMSIATTTKTLSSAASSIAFDNLSGEPTSFAITANANTSTGGTAVTEVIYDGTNFYGSTLTSQVTGSTGFSKSYSNGTLTITATSATFSAIEYKLVYSYGGSSSNVGSDGNYVGSGATSITFNNVTEEPSYFACVFSGNFSTSSGYQRVIGVVYDGTSTYGLAMDSAAKPQTSWSYSYSNGALTITSTGTNNGGYFHSDGTTEYKLVYGIADPSPYEKVSKTYRASTSAQSDTIQPSTGYDAIDQVSVTIPAVTQTNLTAANIKSGTTVSISNGSTNLWSVTGTYSGGGGGSVNVNSTTWTNSSNTTTSHQFTGLSGTPKAAFLRCTSSLSRSSSSTNYFIADMSWDGTTCKGNSFRRSNGTYANVTSGYTVTTGSNSITFSSSGSSTANPGSFYNGTYELVYVY